VRVWDLVFFASVLAGGLVDHRDADDRGLFIFVVAVLQVVSPSVVNLVLTLLPPRSTCVPQFPSRRCHHGGVDAILLRAFIAQVSLMQCDANSNPAFMVSDSGWMTASLYLRGEQNDKE
jgi:hypothetical protein